MVRTEPQQVEYRPETNEITAADILEDEPAPPRRGRPPKQQAEAPQEATVI
jgi:hypothetical protein